MQKPYIILASGQQQHSPGSVCIRWEINVSHSGVSVRQSRGEAWVGRLQLKAKSSQPGGARCVAAKKHDPTTTAPGLLSSRSRTVDPAGLGLVNLPHAAADWIANTSSCETTTGAYLY